MLFLCHPIQTETVNYITQRFVLMGTLFYLATLIFYIHSGLMAELFNDALGTAIAAMFCKEFTVTLPLMLSLYEFYFFNSFKEQVWERSRRLLPFFVIALIVPILLLKTSPQTIGVANIVGADEVHHIDITKARWPHKPQAIFSDGIKCGTHLFKAAILADQSEF